MSGKNWRITGFIITAVGFFIPFAAAKGGGMPMGRYPAVTAIWAGLWLIAFYCLYRCHSAAKDWPTGFRVWRKVAFFIKDYTSYFLILSSLTAANFYPTGLAWHLPQLQMQFVSATLLIMGMAIPVDDWKRIFKHPKPIFQIWAVRWITMPLIALIIGYAIFHSLITDPRMAKTLIASQVLIGTTTTGAASNVYTFLVGGDAPLAVMTTTLSTLTDPVLQPPVASALIGAIVNVPVVKMMIDLIIGVIVPLLVGVFISAVFLRNKVREYGFLFGAVSVLIMIPLFFGAFCAGWATLLKNLYICPILLLVDFLQAGCGLSLGYYLPGKLFGYSEAQRRSAMFEVGVENISITAALAFKYFGPLAATSAGVYGITQTVLVLWVLNRLKAKDEKDQSAIGIAVKLTKHASLR